MFRRLCGGVKCNAPPKRNNAPRVNNAPKPRTRVNNVKNYLTAFDPNSIKVNNGGPWPFAKTIKVIMLVNGKIAGNATVAIGSRNAEFLIGRTHSNFRGQQIGRILRALLTKGVINIGGYNKILHEGSNLNKLVKSNNKNRRPISTRIVRNQLGFRAVSNRNSNFRKGNNMSRINKTLNNYKKGLIGPRARSRQTSLEN